MKAGFAIGYAIEFDIVGMGLLLQGGQLGKRAEGAAWGEPGEDSVGVGSRGVSLRGWGAIGSEAAGGSSWGQFWGAAMATVWGGSLGGSRARIAELSLYYLALSNVHFQRPFHSCMEIYIKKENMEEGHRPPL